LHVVDELSFALAADGFSGMSVDLLQLLREGGARILANAVAEVEAAGLAVDGVLRDSLAGRVSDLVLAEAADWPADLIVIGTHGRRGAGRLFMGSDAEQVLRQASVPVLLVRQPATKVPAS
jgi:nucleotide-binding universal stress UspA family protein